MVHQALLGSVDKAADKTGHVLALLEVMVREEERTHED